MENDKRSMPQSGSVDNTIRRLKTIEGHLRGIIRMVEDDTYCIDVIRQIQAVESALNKGSVPRFSKIT
jgi:DNA-binding FrmR family transcriptional regulator